MTVLFTGPSPLVWGWREFVESSTTSSCSKLSTSKSEFLSVLSFDPKLDREKVSTLDRGPSPFSFTSLTTLNLGASFPEGDVGEVIIIAFLLLVVKYLPRPLEVLFVAPPPTPPPWIPKPNLEVTTLGRSGTWIERGEGGEGKGRREGCEWRKGGWGGGGGGGEGGGRWKEGERWKGSEKEGWKGSVEGCEWRERWW